MDNEPQSSLLHEFGGVGPNVHLAHANGFPPGTYRLLANSLTGSFRVLALPLRPLWPGSRPAEAPNWHRLACDLIQGLDKRSITGTFGIGHSLGGVVTLLAAIHRPDLFRAVVLIDPVILPPTWLKLVGCLRAVGLNQRQPLVQSALRRRRIWSSSQACFAYLRQKSLFARWSDEALHDYVNSGVRDRCDGQVELIYAPEWEAHIFATTPTDIWRHLCRLETPSLIIRGEESATFHPAAQRRMGRILPLAQFATVRSAGHLAPMERPTETGRVIHAFLEERL